MQVFGSRMSVIYLSVSSLASRTLPTSCNELSFPNVGRLPYLG